MTRRELSILTKRVFKKVPEDFKKKLSLSNPKIKSPLSIVSIFLEEFDEEGNRRMSK